MLRVLELIKQVSYNDLILSNLKNTNLIKGDHPLFVYETKSFMFFGMLHDYIIRGGLRLFLEQEVVLGRYSYINNDDDIENILTYG